MPVSVWNGCNVIMDPEPPAASGEGGAQVLVVVSKQGDHKSNSTDFLLFCKIIY